MRTEKEMMDLILNVANADERIRAVSMEGSRANPTIQKDNYETTEKVGLKREDMGWHSFFDKKEAQKAEICENDDKNNSIRRYI